MPYGVVWKRAAEEDLEAIAAINPMAASRILDQIDRHAEEPAALSRAPSFPHPQFPNYQFWIEDVDDSHNLYVTVLFSHDSGGKDIAIEYIGTQLVPMDYPFGT